MHSSNVTSVAWHLEGKWLVTGSEDGTMRIWDTRSVLRLRSDATELTVTSGRQHSNGQCVGCGHPVSPFADARSPV